MVTVIKVRTTELPDSIVQEDSTKEAGNIVQEDSTMEAGNIAPMEDQQQPSSIKLSEVKAMFSCLDFDHEETCIMVDGASSQDNMQEASFCGPESSSEDEAICMSVKCQCPHMQDSHT